MSRDGKTMVYNGPAGVRRRNLETGEESAIANAAIGGVEDISPDGRDAAFPDGGAIMVAALEGGQPREVFRGPLWYVPRWTNDGRYIVALALDTRSGMETATSEIWRIPMGGGAPLKLDLRVAGMESFALHPDNRHFAFSVNEGTKTELWVMENLLRPLKAIR